MSERSHKGKITKLALLAGIVVAAAYAFGTITASPNASGQVNNLQTKTTDDDEQNITPPTLSTAGTATVKVKPDMYSVTAGVITNGTTAQEATSLNAGLMQRVISAVEKLGITNDSISTSNFDVSPIYGEGPPEKMCPQIYPPVPCEPGQVVTGYRASNSITVTLPVQSKVGPGSLIDAAVNAGANNVNGVYFFISQERQQQIRDSLIKEAIANARDRADNAASAVNMTVSGVQSISLNEVYFPQFAQAYASAPTAEGAPATQILPGAQDVSTTVSIVFYLNASGQGGTTTFGEPSGMTRTINNTQCTNPPQGPMIC
jgi:uncharacterized protein YggE